MENPCDRDKVVVVVVVVGRFCRGSRLQRRSTGLPLSFPPGYFTRGTAPRGSNGVAREGCVDLMYEPRNFVHDFPMDIPVVQSLVWVLVA